MILCKPDDMYELVACKLAAASSPLRVEIAIWEDLPQAVVQALYTLTLQAIEKATHDPAEDEVGQQAIEFWSTICDEELELIEEAHEAEQEQPPRPPSRPCQNFVRGAAAFLTPLLLEGLTKQDEDDDDDTWNVAMAAATCLARVAQVVEDEVVQYVTPFIERHITATDWRRREAATLAFGSILEGPSPKALQPYMADALNLMIRLMRDASVQVKDTAAWTIGRVCEHHILAITAEQWQQMTRALQPGEPPEAEGVLLAGLKDEPRVAANVCSALHNLAEHCEETRNNPTNVLSPLFVDLAREITAPPPWTAAFPRARACQ